MRGRGVADFHLHFLAPPATETERCPSLSNGGTSHWKEGGERALVPFSRKKTRFRIVSTCPTRSDG